MGRIRTKAKKAPQEEELPEATVVQLKDVLKDLPMDLVQNLPTLVSRLNAFIAFYSALNLKRLTKLTNYVIQAEEVLFDEKNLLNLDNETLKENYKQAKSATIEILDLARKVSMQIQQEATNKEVDEVYNLLKNLSPDSLEELKEQLISIKSDS
jgi:hypothetical protein